MSSGDLFGLDTLQPMTSNAMGGGGQTMNPMTSSFNTMPSMGNVAPRPTGMQQQMPPRPVGGAYDPFGSINTMGTGRGGQQQQQQPYGGGQYGQRPPQQRR